MLLADGWPKIPCLPLVLYQHKGNSLLASRGGGCGKESIWRSQRDISQQKKGESSPGSLA